MKKTLIILLAAVFAASLAVSATAAVNSNHLIDEGYPDFNEDETKWDIYGWTCVDTPITALGYSLDEADTVWVIDRVITRDDAEKVRENDCFEDLELERAIIEMSLQNGLDEFYGYRMHITLDTSEMTKGLHTFEFIVKYEDGTEGNPCRETVYEINKKKKPTGAVTTAEQTTEEPGEETPPVADLTAEPDTTEEITTEEVTTEALTTETVTTEAVTTAEQTTEAPDGKTQDSDPTAVIIVAVACVVAIGATLTAIILKKKKK